MLWSMSWSTFTHTHRRVTLCSRDQVATLCNYFFTLREEVVLGGGQGGKLALRVALIISVYVSTHSRGYQWMFICTVNIYYWSVACRSQPVCMCFVRRCVFGLYLCCSRGQWLQTDGRFQLPQLAYAKCTAETSGTGPVMSTCLTSPSLLYSFLSFWQATERTTWPQGKAHAVSLKGLHVILSFTPSPPCFAEQ